MGPGQGVNLQLCSVVTASPLPTTWSQALYPRVLDSPTQICSPAELLIVTSVLHDSAAMLEKANSWLLLLQQCFPSTLLLSVDATQKAPACLLHQEMDHSSLVPQPVAKPAPCSSASL